MILFCQLSLFTCFVYLKVQSIFFSFPNIESDVNAYFVNGEGQGIRLFLHRLYAVYFTSLNSNNKSIMYIGCYLLIKFKITLEVQFNLNQQI